MRDIRARHPRLREAMVADAKMWALHRGERSEFRGDLDTLLQILRLMWSSDAFFAQSLYRLKARLQALGVPLLPRLCHRLSIVIGQITIGDPVVIEPGVYINHGLVVIDGLTEIGRRGADRPVHQHRPRRRARSSGRRSAPTCSSAPAHACSARSRSVPAR